MPSKKTPAGTRSVYPVPHVLAAEMRRTEGEIAEITIRRGGWHPYRVTVRVEEEGGPPLLVNTPLFSRENFPSIRFIPSESV